METSTFSEYPPVRAMFLIGGFLLLILFIFLYPMIQKIQNQKKLKRLQKFGSKIICSIIKWENNGTNLSGYSGYNIELTPTSEKDQKAYGTLKTVIYQGSYLIHAEYRNTITGNYKNFLIDEKKNIGKKVNVRINPKNSKDFAVDYTEIDARKMKVPV